MEAQKESNMKNISEEDLETVKKVANEFKGNVSKVFGIDPNLLSFQSKFENNKVSYTLDLTINGKPLELLKMKVDKDDNGKLNYVVNINGESLVRGGYIRKPRYLISDIPPLLRNRSFDDLMTNLIPKSIKYYPNTFNVDFKKVSRVRMYREWELKKDVDVIEYKKDINSYKRYQEYMRNDVA